MNALLKKNAVKMTIIKLDKLNLTIITPNYINNKLLFILLRFCCTNYLKPFYNYTYRNLFIIAEYNLSKNVL